MTIDERIRRIGLNIAYYRKYRGLTQYQLAAITGLSRTHISNIEAVGSHVEPSVKTLFKIADALNISIAALFDFKG